MIDYSIVALFLTGIGLGFIHAFDADHILTVSSLSAQNKGTHKSVHYCAHWATGHGIILLILGFYVYFAGSLIPDILSQWAEVIIGIMLIFLGVWNLLRMKNIIVDRQLPARRTPVVIGLVHGTAGSASVFALIPALQQNNPVIIIIYILLFSLGVLISMLGIGFILQKTQSWASAIGGITLLNIFRTLISLAAILLGIFWLFFL